jgi:hypothetical protein
MYRKQGMNIQLIIVEQETYQGIVQYSTPITISCEPIQSKKEKIALQEAQIAKSNLPPTPKQ